MDVKQMQISDWYELFMRQPEAMGHVETIVDAIHADEPISSSDYEFLAAYAVIQVERQGGYNPALIAAE